MAAAQAIMRVFDGIRDNRGTSTLPAGLRLQMTFKTNNLVACPECDCLMARPLLEENAVADCARCGAELYRAKPHALDRSLAFLAAAAILFLVANTHPLMELQARGIPTSATIYQTAITLAEMGMPSVCLLVLATTIVIPALQLVFTLAVLVPLKLGYVPDLLPLSFRVVTKIWPWGMIEVYLLGALIAYVKLQDIATVYPGLGLYAIGGYAFAISAAVSSFEPREVWKRAEALRAGEGRTFEVHP
jgi:paraquat-inducible protein A